MIESELGTTRARGIEPLSTDYRRHRFAVEFETKVTSDESGASDQIDRWKLNEVVHNRQV